MLLNEAIKQFEAWRLFKVKEATNKGYAYTLKQFAVYMKNCDIASIGHKDVISWFGLLKTMDADVNSFIPRASALRKFFEFFRKQGMRVLDPWLIPLPDKEYKPARILDQETYDKLLSVIPENNDPRHVRNRVLINLYWDTGARNAEILSLNMQDLDTVKMKAVIKTEKAKSRRPFRQIFWTDETNQNLLRWLNHRDKLNSVGMFTDQEAVFIGISGNKYGRRLTNKGVGEMLRRYSHQAGISPIANAHSFRHHMGHSLVEKGANNSTISSILGHSSLASSFTYTMLNDKETENQYRKFNPAMQQMGDRPNPWMVVDSFKLPRQEKGATMQILKDDYVKTKNEKKPRDRQAERSRLKLLRNIQKIQFEKADGV